MLLCANVANIRASVLPPAGCDTLTTVEGKTYLVSNVEELWQELRFTTCDDASRVYSMPRDRVASVKKAKPPMVLIPALPPPKPIAAPKPNPKPNPKLAPAAPVDSMTRMATKALNLGTIALICSLTIILSPVGLIVGLVSIGRGVEGLNTLKKHPNRRKLRRKLWLAIILGGLAILPFIAFILLLKAIRDFPDFSGLGNIGAGWTWGCC